MAGPKQSLPPRPMLPRRLRGNGAQTTRLILECRRSEYDGKPICVPAARQEDYRRAIVAIQARIYRLAMNQQVLIAEARLSLKRARFQSAGDHQGADDAHWQILQIEALVAFLSQTHPAIAR